MAEHEKESEMKLRDMTGVQILAELIADVSEDCKMQRFPKSRAEAEARAVRELLRRLGETATDAEVEAVLGA